MAAGILERERGETIRLAVADPPIFRQDGGPSIGERMRRAGRRAQMAAKLVTPGGVS